MSAVHDQDPNPGARCPCGSVHPEPTHPVVVEEDAFERLADFVGRCGWSQPLLVMDANTEEVAGARVAGLLRADGVTVLELCYGRRSGLLADEGPVASLEAVLSATPPDGIVAVGSGVITDIVRYVAANHGLAFVSVPTAASMDGYASGVSVMEFGGMKASFSAAPPRAIFAEPQTIAAAPAAMTRAGVGDLLGKASAGTDWLAAHLLCGEARCDEVAREVDAAVGSVAAAVEDILGGSPEAAAGLLRGLVVTGAAIAKVGSSRPASGSEHQLSHFWDLMAADGRRPHSAHGLQVGYAAQFTMRLQLSAFAGGIRSLKAPMEAVLGDEVAAYFTGHEAQIAAVMEEKHRIASAARATWPAEPSAWEASCSRLGEAMVAFPLVAGALSRAGIPADPWFLGLDPGTLRESLRWANRIRPRYSVLDFLEGQGLIDEFLESLLPTG